MTAASQRRLVAVVTGANRGLGKETARQLAAAGYDVVLTGRDLAKTEAAAADIVEAADIDTDVTARALDITDSAQARDVAAFVRDRYGRLDALVNNAGVLLDRNQPNIVDADIDVIARNVDINAFGTLRVAQAFADLLAQGDGGNMVNVSSGMGGLTEMGTGAPAYRLSKTALNGVTRLLHHDLHPRGVRVNAVCPGWVRTDMGGANANRDLAQGGASIVWGAKLGADGPSGGFFRDGEPIAW